MSQDTQTQVRMLVGSHQLQTKTHSRLRAVDQREDVPDVDASTELGRHSAQELDRVRQLVAEIITNVVNCPRIASHERW